MNNKLTHDAILKFNNLNIDDIDDIDIDLALGLYKFSKRLRIIEERIAAEYHPADEMKCPVHFCTGQEAVPSSINMIIQENDFLFSHHRSHGYYLAKNCRNLSGWKKIATLLPFNYTRMYTSSRHTMTHIMTDTMAIAFVEVMALLPVALQ